MFVFMFNLLLGSINRNQLLTHEWPLVKTIKLLFGSHNVPSK